MAINGDVVVIVETDELAKAPVTGQGGGLIGDTLHVAAVTEDDISVKRTKKRMLL